MEYYIFGLLLLCNGFFALSEIALVSSKPNRLEQFKNSGKKGAFFALKLQSDSENFLSAIQVGITLIGIVTGVYSGSRVAQDIVPFLKILPWIGQYANQVSLALSIVFITYLSIVIGELVPKTIALNNPEKIAIFVAPIIFAFSRAFHPVVHILSISTGLLNKLMHIPKRSESLTESDLRYLLATASSQGILAKQQTDLHEKLFTFSDKKAKHLVTHRTEVEWLDIELSPSELKEQLTQKQHSNLVVCKNSLDNFLGTLSIKDVFKVHLIGDTSLLKSYIRPPIIVPEITDATRILEIFKTQKAHILFVVNEYGGFEGIITLHNIIENFIGSLQDKGEEPDVLIREDKSVLVSGDAPIETLLQIMDGLVIDFDRIDYKTVAGFILAITHHIPKIGEIINHQGYKIEILDLDGNRIDKIMVSKLPD